MSANVAQVPKSMPAPSVVWAFRYGVASAMMSRGNLGPIRRWKLGYVSAPSNVMRLADRVRREWLRRHPEPSGSESRYREGAGTPYQEEVSDCDALGCGRSKCIDGCGCRCHRGARQARYRPVDDNPKENNRG